jgi:hypothetical protein
VLILRKWPITTLLASQYLFFVIVPALAKGDESNISFILGLIVPAVCVSLFVESALAPLGTLGGRDRDISWNAIIVVTAVGFGAKALASLQGASSYETQIGSRALGALSSLFTPFQPWTLVGPLLGLYAAKTGRISRERCLALLAAASVLIVAQHVYLAILGPAMSYLLAMAFGAVLAGVVRLRWVVVAAVAVALAWPTIHALRQENRLRYGITDYNLRAQASPEQRLQLDKNIALAADIDTPADVGQPGLVQILKFGLLPRLLDPDRPELATGKRVSVALGGAPNTSFGFTTLGNVYVLSGHVDVIVFVVVFALLMGVLLRLRGVAPFVLSVLVARECFWIDAGYPDSIAGLLAGAMAMVIALFFTVGLGGRFLKTLFSSRQPAVESVTL